MTTRYDEINDMGDGEFLALPRAEQVAFAREVAFKFDEPMSEAQLEQVVDLHRKVAQMSPEDRGRFFEDVSRDTAERDRQTRGSVWDEMA